MKNVIERLEAYCVNHPEKKAVLLNERIVTYGEMKEQLAYWHSCFQQCGIQKGQKILLAAADPIRFLVLWLVIWKAGAIPIPAEADLPKEELLRAAESALPEYIITDQDQIVIALQGQNQAGWVKTFQEIRIKKLKHQERLAETAFLVYTSGTTGKPKCVVYDFNSVYATLDSLTEAYQLTEEDMALTPMSPALPAALFSIILPVLFSGGTLILEKQPIPGKLLKTIQNSGITIFFAVPYLYRLLLEAAHIRGFTKNQSLRLCLSTSAYLKPEVFEQFYRLTGQMIRSMFCTSEAMYLTYQYEEDYDKIMHSVGKPQKGVQIRILNADGEEAGRLEEGEIAVSGTHTSKGYYKNSDLWEKVQRNGWVYTGDNGYMDADGYLYITGRIHNTINVSGYLVSPEEVEDVIETHPFVMEALVTGEDEEMTGESVTAYIVAGREMEKETILSYCRDSLPGYKVPSRIVFQKELEKGRYGKKKRDGKQKGW